MLERTIFGHTHTHTHRSYRPFAPQTIPTGHHQNIQGGVFRDLEWRRQCSWSWVVTAAIIETHPSNRGQEYPSLAFVVWVKSFCHLLSSFLFLEPSVYSTIELKPLKPLLQSILTTWDPLSKSMSSWDVDFTMKLSVTKWALQGQIDQIHRT